MDKRQKNQVFLALAPKGRGEAPDPVRQGTESIPAKSHPESPVETRLIEEVVNRENLFKALKRVKDNGGAPGVDGMTVQQLPDFLREHWPRIKEELLKGTYRPQPVRRVGIPKLDGGTRNLGIPSSVDRFIQQAVLQVLQKRWDKTFSDHSYGFRPGRSAHQAIAQAQNYIKEGFTWVVDLEKFFGSSRIGVRRVGSSGFLASWFYQEIRMRGGRHCLPMSLWPAWADGKGIELESWKDSRPG